jgi:RND family efflux transporter MFP subunit
VSHRPFVRLLLCLLACLVPACAPAPSPAADAAEEELEPATITLFGERVLLFLEHPRLVRGEPARFLAHFTVLADGEPVRRGRVTLDLGGERFTAEEPRRDGLFTPEGSPTRAGRFPATLALEGPDATEVLDLGEVVVHAGLDEARAEAEAEPAPPADGVPFLMEQQWKVPVLFAQAGPALLVDRLSVPAATRLAEGAAAVVAAPVDGRLLPPATGGLPRSGERVTAGQVLGLVEPLLSASELAQVRVLELELAREALAVERDLADARAGLQLAEREHERLVRLRRDSLATEQALDAAVRDLAVARAASQAAEAAQRTLGEWRARQPGLPGATPLQVPLAAPIDGVLLAEGRVSGEAVEAGAPLFRVVDASRLEIEGRVTEFDLQRLAAPPRASATFAALPGLRVELGGDAGARLLLESPELEGASRSLALRYELPAVDPRLRAGLLAELELAAGEVQAEVAVPTEAILVEQGQPTAWVVLEGELFQRRALRLGARDGESVQVLAGLQAGEHVVTRGVSTLRLAALSPAAFGAGHQH